MCVVEGNTRRNYLLLDWAVASEIITLYQLSLLQEMAFYSREVLWGKVSRWAILLNNVIVRVHTHVVRTSLVTVCLFYTRVQVTLNQLKLFLFLNVQFWLILNLFCFHNLLRLSFSGFRSIFQFFHRLFGIWKFSRKAIFVYLRPFKSLLNLNFEFIQLLLHFINRLTSSRFLRKISSLGFLHVHCPDRSWENPIILEACGFGVKTRVIEGSPCLKSAGWCKTLRGKRVGVLGSEVFRELSLLRLEFLTVLEVVVRFVWKLFSNSEGIFHLILKR